MWKDHHVPEDNDWIVAGMERGTLICVTDGSYDRKKAPTICGAGWIIMCSSTKKYVKGSFAEHSQSASSYRGKLLGMLAIHLFLLAIKEHYMVEGDKNQIFCDNLRAIYTFQRRSQRVTSGEKNADIQRVLR